MGYDFWLSPEATRALLGSDLRERIRIEQTLERLAAAPFVESDFREQSPQGRIYHVKCFDDIVVTYWLDHAVKEIRILRVERA